MSEWVIVTVLVTMVSFVIAIVTPIVKLNTTITKLNTVVEIVTRDLTELTDRNSKTHDRLWAHNSAQDRLIQEHEYKIKTLSGKDD